MSFYIMRHRKCATCNKEIKEGDVCYQVEVDDRNAGFTYVHKNCFEKKKPLPITYKW